MTDNAGPRPEPDGIQNVPPFVPKSVPGKIFYGITFCMDWIYRILLEYAKLVLLVIVVIVSAQVFCRKVLNTSIPWSEEVALVLMVWMAFISMAIGVEKNLHVAITLFFGMFPKKVQFVFTKINTAITLAFGFVLVAYGSILVKGTMKSTLPATQWPAAVTYIMMPVGGIFIIYFTFIGLFGLDRFRHRNIEDGGDA